MVLEAIANPGLLVVSAADQADVAVGLRVVTERSFADGVVFLGQQASRPGCGGEVAEQLFGLVANSEPWLPTNLGAPRRAVATSRRVLGGRAGDDRRGRIGQGRQ
jgi:hypothetical protein